MTEINLIESSVDHPGVRCFYPKRGNEHLKGTDATWDQLFRISQMDNFEYFMIRFSRSTLSIIEEYQILHDMCLTEKLSDNPFDMIACVFTIDRTNGESFDVH